MYSIGEIISTYRKKKGLLQQDLADELAKEGITISYKAISNWERNLAEPSVTIFYKVCRILGITNMYEAYFGVNPADPFSSLTDEGIENEYSCAITPQVRQAGNRLSGLTETAYASLLA